MTQELSDYELIRANNIKRNEEFMKSLGICPSIKEDTFQRTSSTLKRKKTSSNNEAENSFDDGQDRSPTGIRVSSLERKRSRRLQNMDPEFSIINPSLPINLVDTSNEDGLVEGGDFDLPLISIGPQTGFDYEEEDAERVPVNAQQMRQFIEANNPAHSDLIPNAVITHTVYRMSYMSTKDLALRMRKVSGGRGKTSRIKLLAFYYGLLLANLNSLAASAKEIIDQLGDIS